jgi:hypothetical protein
MPPIIRLLARFVAAACVLVAAGAGAAAAQDPVGGGGGGAQARPGWTLTPSFAFAGTYDDNISFFGQNTAEEQNNDYISSYAPRLDLSFRGRRTLLGLEYSGSFLNYQTFSIFDQWQQRGGIAIRREESKRLQWSGHVTAAKSPSTETVELGGIPFAQTGTTVVESQASVGYELDFRNHISASVQHQDVEFERPDEVRQFLRGGQVLAIAGGYRRRISGRLGMGADYGLRHASVVDDVERSRLHTVHAAFDYTISQAWTFTGGAGGVYVEGSDLRDAQAAPAFRGSAAWTGRISAFHIGYERSFIPSFGFGGTVRSQDLTMGYRTALFRSRHFYTDHSAGFRDTEPFKGALETLPLRSLRTNSVLGWTPEPWVRIELFYAHIQQTSLRPGGRLDRNRVGFQIVTTKPMRMQ